MAAMSLRQVRCPHCSRRYDVTGVEAGTLLRCGGCAAVLRVPSVPPSRPLPLFRIAAGATAGLATMVVLALALRPSPPPASAAAHAAATPARAAELPNDPGLGIIDDALTRLKMELSRDFPGSRFVYSEAVRPYVLVLEPNERFVDGERIREYGHELELAYTAYRRDVADRIGLPAVTDTILPVVVLSSRAAFDRHCERADGRRQPAETKGYYDWIRRRIVTYQDAVVPRDVMLHEGAHQLLHYHQLRQTETRKVHVSFWLQEGLASYCEGLRRRVDGEIVLDPAVDSRRFPLLRHVAERADRGEFVPLAKLVEMSVDGYWDQVHRLRQEDPSAADRQAQILYAESWALVHFLRQSGPRHRRVFESALRRELSGSASKRSFAEVLRAELGVDPAELEPQFLRYIQSLR
jgi:hypothetical protein